MKVVRIALCGVLGGLLVSACGSSHGGDGADAGRPPIVLPDAAGIDRPDPLPDSAVPLPGQIGSACTSDPDCGEGGTCLEADFVPGGYCTISCTDADCPTGSTCVQLSRTQAYCMDECTPGASTRQCRAGYGCATSPDFPAPVCIIGCSDASDCAAGECNPEGGDLGAGACYNPAAMVGAECTADDMCPTSGVCFTEVDYGWPHGACITTGCDPDADTGCPGDAHCLLSGRTPVCVDGCTANTDCRTGYTCRASTTFPSRMTCQPACTSLSQCTEGRTCNTRTGTCAEPFIARDLGQACMDGSRCAGGACLGEFQGYPGSYCAAIGCSTTEVPSGCPGDGVCVPTTDGTNYCFDGCTTSSDCRAGYRCGPSVASNPSSPLACVPGCRSDMDCTFMGFVCNEGLGTCGRAFNTMLLGRNCTGVMGDCRGGTCETEASAGWPGGMCTLGGCRISGEGPAETCPTGSACVDDHLGAPDLGVCTPTCTPTADGMGAGGCRTGYVCVPTSAGATTGSCAPHCTISRECTDGRVCTDGLCRMPMSP